MKFRARGRMQRQLALVCLVAVVVVVVPCVAPRAQNFPGPLNNLTAGGTLPLPPPPPQGDFFQVIFANAKWLVVQNMQGQQFPVAADATGQFLIRWQADARDLLQTAVRVEAIGPEQASMTIQTDHIDLFVGGDMALVNPGYASVLPINRPATALDPTYQRYMNGFDISAQNQLYSFVYPVPTGFNGIPSKMHAVGSPAGVNPLRLGVPGNNIVTVLPPIPPGFYSITQVTPGSVSFAKKGDVAFLTPIPGNSATPRSLILSQVVLYKKIRRDQFVP